MNVLDLFTGIGGFHLASKKCGLNTIAASEIDKYNVKLIDRNLNIDNGGDINNVCVPLKQHPDIAYQLDDKVACEETGFSSITLEDFFEGALAWPDVVTAGFPCQDLSSANLHGNHVGLDGARSGLVWELMRIIENLEPKFVVLENSPNLIKKGLAVIASEFDKLGYDLQYETISCANFGYPHWRKRVYIVAYRRDTVAAANNHRFFDLAKSRAVLPPNHFLPTLDSTAAELAALVPVASVENTRSIKLRTKRINGLGNSIVPDIAQSILESIKSASSRQRSTQLTKALPLSDERVIAISSAQDMPPNGIYIDGVLHSGTRCTRLNPTIKKHRLFSTLSRKDGNNNFTTKSRLNRPGKLGGLTGDLMRCGADKGGLDPLFCELFMGFPEDWTKLK